ncbi:MAG: bifunctional 2-polyprenyl-6-hydroxyphenol methylase/3-demethylubiquinol 3-O-methyltransferase UbiG [bacterium]
MQQQNSVNVDHSEVSKFDAVAAGWWDEQGEMSTLHHINPVRMEFILQHVSLTGKSVLDVGCGGGLLSEALCKAGAQVKGIDASQKAIQVAQLHALETGLQVDYENIRSDELKQQNIYFDHITCMEMLEHVPEPQAVIEDCVSLLKPGGYLFLSTINRNLKSYALAVLGAEYIMNIVPKGTHDYARFIKPSELAQMGRNLGLQLIEVRGMGYNPLTQNAWLETKPDVNYLMVFKKS